MNALRWTLGLTTAFLGSGYLFLFLVANGFRRSFGASENNPLRVIVPLMALALLFASVLFPAQKTLLHLDEQNRSKPELSYAYTFNLQEMKAPLIEAITRAGWTRRPTIWQGPAWLRWLTE